VKRFPILGGKETPTMKTKTNVKVGIIVVV
jgi:hypothetical protein